MALLRPGWEGRVRRDAAGLPDRMCRPDHACRAPPRRPLQYRAPRAGEIPDRRGRSRAVRTGSRRSIASKSGCTTWIAEAMREARRKLEALLVPQPEGTRRRTEGAPVDGRRRSRQRAGAVSRARAGREASATRTRGAPRPLPFADRAARDEGDRRATQMGRRALTHQGLLNPLDHAARRGSGRSR